MAGLNGKNTNTKQIKGQKVEGTGMQKEAKGGECFIKQDCPEMSNTSLNTEKYGVKWLLDLAISNS